MTEYRFTEGMRVTLKESCVWLSEDSSGIGVVTEAKNEGGTPRIKWADGHSLWIKEEDLLHASVAYIEDHLKGKDVL